VPVIGLDTKSSPPKLLLYVFNLVAIILLGLFVCGWLLFYTDYFPVIGGLLGLGGLFAWIAFLANLVSDQRKEQLQDTFDSGFLQKRKALGVMLLVIIGFICLIVMRYGSIVFENPNDGQPRVTTVRGISGMEVGDVVKDTLLMPRGGSKVLLLTGFFGKRDYHLKLNGLPARRVTVKAGQRSSISVPAYFLSRPVALIRPSADYSRTAAKGENLILEIHLADELLISLPDYRGEGVWVGAADDVPPPALLVEQWRIELITAGQPVVEADRWKRVRAPLPNADLKEKSILKATVKDKKGNEYATGYVSIPQGFSPAQFPLQVIVDD
jgi:hypothetical protein